MTGKEVEKYIMRDLGYIPRHDCENVLGAGQGNELSGDFSANISLGYKIENGEIVGRIKDTMISGNCFKALEKIDHLSKDTKNLYGRIELPFLQTENIEITS